MFRNIKNRSIDKCFEKIDFKKIDDNDYIVQYERFDENSKSTQCLDILHKKSGNHIVQSYQKDCLDKDGFGRMWGMTLAETKLALKKAKVKGWE